jgi:LysM repeat protein
MRNRTSLILILLIFMVASLMMTACVRPYPGSEAAASQPTPNPADIQPIEIPQEPVPLPELPVEEVELGESEEVVVEPTEVPPEPVEPTAEPPTETTHTVVAGDTLFKIALDNGVTVDEIAAANGITDVDSLEIGVILIIPVPGAAAQPEAEESEQPATAEEQAAAGETEQEQVPATEETTAAPDGAHVVQLGDNLYRIGLKYGCSVEQIALHNGIINPNRISVGQQIQIPNCN